MVEVVLLQIPPSVRKVLWVCAANHCYGMYVEHVLLHSFILLLLNLIHCPYHGIVVMFVAKHLLHVHQHVLHRDILALIQGVGPFTRVPAETSKEMRVHTGLIILLKEGIHIKPLLLDLLTLRLAYPILQEPTASSPYYLCGPCVNANSLWFCLQWCTHQSLVLPCLVRKEASLLCLLQYTGT